MIRARVAEVDQRLATLDAAVRLLRTERVELETALKVIERFAGDDDDATEPNLEGRRVGLAEAAAEIEERQSGGKPPGTPPIADMILEILSEASVRGSSGLSPKEMVPIIRERWWPEARGESIGSIAWRMAKRGNLLTEDGRYYIPAPPSGELFGRSDEASEEEAA